MPSSKLELSTVLRHLDQRNFDIYQSLRGDDAAKREIERLLGFVLPIWMADAAKNSEHAALVWRFNRIANAGWYALRGHPELQLKLLAHVGLGKPTKHAFHHLAPSPTTSRLADLLRLSYPDIRRDEIVLWCRKNSESALSSLMAAHGVQAEQAEAILKDYHKVVMS